MGEEYTEGEKSKAFCFKCACIVDTTFKKKPLGSFKTGVMEYDLLTGCCDNCGTVVSVPMQTVDAMQLRDIRRIQQMWE